jgi:uncharacterized protein with NRDE domain
MCLIVVAHAAAERYPLVVVANRDELHSRPTRPAGWWPEQPEVLAGRDLRAGGTWLGVDRRGRMAAVTNVRDGAPAEAPRSRGTLVADYLVGGESAAAYAALTMATGAAFAAFNLLVLDGAELRYASNRGPTARLAAGIHALSNAPLGVEWPKTISAKAGVARWLAASDPLDALFVLLAERGNAASAEERYRTAHFVTGPSYGTRCSTIIVVDAGRRLTFAERSFDADGIETSEVRETFELDKGG